jgi:hypothetical protein
VTVGECAPVSYDGELRNRAENSGWIFDHVLSAEDGRSDCRPIVLVSATNSPSKLHEPKREPSRTLVIIGRGLRFVSPGVRPACSSRSFTNSR